jgi:hypothetical protein
MLVPPGEQGPEDRAEIAPALSQDVLVPGRVFAVTL